MRFPRKKGLASLGCGLCPWASPPQRHGGARLRYFGPRQVPYLPLRCCHRSSSDGHENAIRELLEQGRARLVVTTLGAEGCIVVTRLKEALRSLLISPTLADTICLDLCCDIRR